MGQTTSKLPCLFSPIFDDAVLPRAFVFSLGHSCQARCYPRSPPKNLRPRAAAPQTLNRSIRHTMLRAAGVLSCGCGCVSCPSARDVRIISLSHTHTELHATLLQKLSSAPYPSIKQQIYSFVLNVPLSCY